ncbi:hypothetical protein Isolate57596_50510 (plasmid) [Mycobacteroides abscessus subsp. abscessus]
MRSGRGDAEYLSNGCPCGTAVPRIAYRGELVHRPVDQPEHKQGPPDLERLKSFPRGCEAFAVHQELVDICCWP